MGACGCGLGTVRAATLECLRALEIKLAAAFEAAQISRRCFINQARSTVALARSSGTTRRISAARARPGWRANRLSTEPSRARSKRDARAINAAHATQAQYKRWTGPPRTT